MSEDVVHYWPTGRELSPCGVDLLNTPYTYGTEDWADVTCGDCKLEQPAQKVPGRVEYEIPAEVQHVDALLAAADKRAIAARKVIKWTARLNAALAEERRLTDAPVQLWPAPAEVTLNELHAATEARRMQLKPFLIRAQELCVQGKLSPREAKQAALDEAHERAIEIEWQAALDEAHGRALEIEQRRERWIPVYGKPMPY